MMLLDLFIFSFRGLKMILQNKKLAHLLSFLMSVFVTFIFLKSLAFILSKKESRFKSKSFFMESQDIDVFFLGTSHGVNAFFPMELWEDFGIVSYNLSYHNAMLPMQYWVLKNALLVKKPKLVVIDLFWLSQPWKSDPNLFGTVHTVFDEFPLSKAKVQMAYDILDDNVPAADDDSARLSLIFPFSMYHSRWTEFFNDNFAIGVEKGSESRIRVETSPAYYEPIDRENKISIDSIGVQYLEKIITLCQENDIDVLLVYLPFAAWSDCQREANVGYDIAKKYDVYYINFLENIDIINFETDRYDSVGHLNPSGARKVNDYLGNFILANYKVNNQKENPLYAKWNEDYKKYKHFKIDNLKSQNTLDTYLMLLADKHLSACVFIRNPVLFQNKLYCNLLKNLHIDINKSAFLETCFLVENGGKSVKSCQDIKLFTTENSDIAVFVYDNDGLVDNSFFDLNESGVACRSDSKIPNEEIKAFSCMQAILSVK